MKGDKIHIGVIEDSASVGGAQVNIFTLAKYLSARYRLTVFCPPDGDLVKELDREEIDHVTVSMNRLISTSMRVGNRFLFNPLATGYDFISSFLQSRKLTQLLRGKEVDLVHTNSMWAHFLGGMAATRIGIPCLWHVQDIISDKLCFGLVRRLFKVTAERLADRVVVVSEAVRDMFDREHNPPVEVVHNGVDVESFSVNGKERQNERRRWGVPEEAILVGMVGRLTPWKGQRTFLRAAKEVLKERNDLYFAFVGKATKDEQYYEKELLTMAQSLLPPGRAIFQGYRSDLPKALAAFDIGVLASEEPEPFGRVLIEYMAGGLPVIGTRVGGVSECVKHGETGLLIPSNNIEKMASAIVKLASNSLMRKEMGNRGRLRAHSEFSAIKFASRVERIYKDLLG